MSESWGRGERFGIVDIGFDEIYWFAVADAEPGGVDREVRAELLERFGDWHEPIAAIISATPSSESCGRTSAIAIRLSGGTKAPSFFSAMPLTR